MPLMGAAERLLDCFAALAMAVVVVAPFHPNVVPGKRSATRGP